MNGRNSLVDNIELSGAIDNISGDHNWAGIRFDGGATGNHIVRNSFFHDNDNGFLGGAATDAVLVEGSKFEHLGRDGFAHGMYMGVGQKFILRNSVVTSNKNDGHLVKTRALANTIECNMIAGLNGQNSYAVDVPQGGDTVIRNNVIQNGPNANNRNAFVDYQEEGAVNPISNLSVHDNTLINDTPMAYFFWLPRSPNLVGWANNLLVGGGTPFNPGGSSTTGVTQKTRADAGLPPYDGTLASLPAAPFCN